ncbi:MAG: YihY/virulence factor BrkB family protein [Bryobacteraceae bacterium]|nr:YihY/virulence factor BrkB family protein [Bryobacteraceae bacterium]
MLSFGQTKSLLVHTWQDWNQDQAPRLGAALSFYTMLSIAPLLILLIAIAGLVFGEEAARGQLFGQIRSLVGDEGAGAIQEMVQNASKPGSGVFASLVGFVTLLVGASTVATELQYALNQIWTHKPIDDPGGITSMVKQKGLALAVVLGAGFLLVTSLAVSSVIAVAGTWFSGFLPLPELALQVLNLLLSIAVITGVFAVLFRYLPDAVRPSWRDVLPGALFTSVLFSIGKTLIGLYLGKASVGSTYGAAGSLVIVLIWVYYSAQILFFGAEFTQVYAREYGTDPLHCRGRSKAEPQHAEPVRKK